HPADHDPGQLRVRMTDRPDSRRPGDAEGVADRVADGVAGHVPAAIASREPAAMAGHVPAAIALSPILSARYRPQDLQRIEAAAPGARLVMVSRDGHADGAVEDVEVLLRGALSTDAFDRFL